jgi:nucleoid-associated protein YgaU
MMGSRLRRAETHSHTTRRAPKTLVLGVSLLLGLTFTPSVFAQSAENEPLSVPQNSTRAELLELLERTNAQLEEAMAADAQGDIDRLLELKAQFEILLLQAELEALRQENAGLREQTGASAPATTASGGAAAEIDAIEEEFTQLDEQQNNVIAQLETIADQHAILLEQLGSAPEAEAETPEAAPTGMGEEDSQLRQDLAELQRRYAQLNEQQGVVNAQLQEITDEHGALLDQLGSAPESAPRTHTVQQGDSLSRLAQRYYGSGNAWPQLLEANPTLTNPNRLLVGTVLTIP